MNKGNAKYYLPLVQALADGKTIQGYHSNDNGWIDYDGRIVFSEPANEYRIKPVLIERWALLFGRSRIGDTIYESRDDAVSHIHISDVKVIKLVEVEDV